MRGDSLRDFYAKTLAVVGLGLLAGAGAIVDYWPVNEELPTTPAVSGLIAPAPVLVQNLSIAIPAPFMRAPRAPRRLPDDFIIATADVQSAEMTTASAAAITLDSAPIPSDFVVVRSIPPSPSDQALGLDSPPLPDGTTEESRRLLADALKRTKERIAAARGLFSDAMSGVAGAFRRVSPFFTTTAILPGL